MVTLNTLILVGLIVATVTAVATVAFFLLLGCYLNTKEMKKEKCDEEDNVFTIPMSNFPNMSGGRPITQADVDRARAAMAAGGMGVGHPAAPAEAPKAEYVPGEGAYI